MFILACHQLFLSLSDKILISFPMFRLISLYASDALGKIDMTSLSEQTKMELLIEDFGYQEPLQSADGDYLDVSEWPGVVTDTDGTVTNIEWAFDQNTDYFQTNGRTIQLQYIPENVIDFSISECKMLGTVCTHDLPRNMKWLDISCNDFSGEFDIAGLPSCIGGAYIQHNKFCGSLSIPDLPPQIQDLFANDNKFSGTVDLSKLPDTMIELTLSDNAFVQEGLHIGMIPPEVCTIQIRKNQFGKVTCVEGRHLQTSILFNILSIQSIKDGES